MPRKPLIRTADYPYHVTIRSNNKEWFEISMGEMWKLCMDSLSKALFKFPVEVEAFVLMSNHYHLLLTTPDANLDKFMQAFNSDLSKGIRVRTQRKNRVFGDRYKWSLISDQSYYWNVVRYIFQNPLRAGIVKKCEEYPFSSLYYHSRGSHLPFQAPDEFNDPTFIEDINEPLSFEQTILYKKALQSVGEFGI